MSTDHGQYDPPPLFDKFPAEKHDAMVLTSFPKNTFLENIAVDEQGMIYVTSLEEGAVYRVSPAGGKEVHATISGKPAGILYLGGQSFLLNGWDGHGIPTLYLLSGRNEIRTLHQPEGAKFLNGMAAVDDQYILICDSFAGCIWCYNRLENTSAVWLAHELLSKVDMDNFYMPAANGIKLFGNNVYVSNTEKHLLLRIPLNGILPGLPEIFMEQLNLDDFAFDNTGNMYATTHIYNSVVKITPEKHVTVIGGQEQGLTGSTAVAFGKTDKDSDCIYVTTNGGMSLPYEGKIQNGRVVRIKVS